MKIAQQVGEFAKQTAQDRPGDGSEARAREFAAKQNAGVGSFVAAEEAEAGMAEMSEKFREEGGEIYLPLDAEL
jgi:phosphomethylpyrimidine synthase